MRETYDINVGIYSTTIQLIISDDIRKEEEKLDISHTYFFDAFCLWDQENKLEYEFYIVLHKDFTVGYLLHECIHCASRILYSRGVYVSYLEDESLTYLTQFIFEKILTTLAEGKKDFSLKI